MTLLLFYLMRPYSCFITGSVNAFSNFQKIELGEQFEKGKNTTINIHVKSEESESAWTKLGRTWLYRILAVAFFVYMWKTYIQSNGKLPGVGMFVCWFLFIPPNIFFSTPKNLFLGVYTGISLSVGREVLSAKILSFQLLLQFQPDSLETSHKCCSVVV